MACECALLVHEPRLVVLTGGPGAGKTAVLETVRQHFCEHVNVLPEAASIVFGGGFPREDGVASRASAQRAIFHVQRELERCAVEAQKAAVVLCDRGTLDGLAYWPLAETDYLSQLSLDRAAELARYAAVVHLKPPSAERGYDHSNPLRVESASEARAIDERIVHAWSGHPRRRFVESTADFLEKLARAVAFIREEVPPCCRKHRIPEIDR